MRAIRVRGEPGRLPAIVLALLALLAVVAVGVSHPARGAGAPVFHSAPAPVMVPADCQCGGPGGSATLAHISPWNNAACNHNTEVGRAGIHAYKSVNGTLTDVYVGWAQELYSSYGSCHGYQWTAFHMVMAGITGTTAWPGFTEMIWLSQDPLTWTTFAVTYQGGQQDGNFWSYAVLAGPLSTTDGIWTSLVHFVGQHDGLFAS